VSQLLSTFFSIDQISSLPGLVFKSEGFFHTAAFSADSSEKFNSALATDSLLACVRWRSRFDFIWSMTLAASAENLHLARILAPLM
jgi:hypothetical protein